MESRGPANMVPLSPLFLTTLLSILAMSPASLGFVIGSPHSTDNLSRFLAGLQLLFPWEPLHLLFIPLFSMKPIAGGVWPGRPWLSLGMPDNIQEEFKKRQ